MVTRTVCAAQRARSKLLWWRIQSKGCISLPPLQISRVSCDWVHGNPKMSVRRCPQEVVSGGLLQSTQTQELYISDRYHTSDGSVQSPPLYENCPVQLQRQTHEASSYCIGHSFYSSPSIQSCSSGGSPASPQTSQTYPSDVHYFPSPGEQYGSSGSGYSSNQPETELKYMLQELETALMGPDSDNPDNFESTYEENMSSEFSEWNLESMHDTNDSYCQSSLSVYAKAEQVEISLDTQDGVKEEIENEMDLAMSCNTSNVSKEQKQEPEDDIPHGDIRKLLVACAKAIDDNDLVNIDKWVAELRQLVSVSGHPMERLGAYMVEGLVARMACSGATIYKALRCKEPASAELLSYMQILYEVCPYFKFGYMAANGAIAEAFKDEDRVHIVDFQIAQGSQWVTLLQALAARPKGPPHVHITGVDDPMSEYARGGGLEFVGKRLSKLAETFKVPFEFHAVPVMGADVQVHMLEVRPRDALAVNFAFQLHHLPDESVNTSNHRDRILRMVKGLRPKVVTLVEQESNTNTAPFFPRFMETLSYYTAIFESLDVTLPRESKERINVEQHCLARDIVNIIACEGAERVERHELMGKWRSRFSMAGFKPYPLSSIVNSTIKLLLEDYCKNYSLLERDNTLYLGWSDRPLIASTAWQ
ncbi:hypothetical protein SUGI_0962750 [Cryptomeria japonica]|nr:hypothetical protein SUGI_0962750 [Cryptomeria japonica]